MYTAMTRPRPGAVNVAVALAQAVLLLLVYPSHTMADGLEFICETTDASPDLNEAIDAASQLGEVDFYCSQDNGSSDEYWCTDWHHVGGAATGMCGDHGSSIQCYRAAIYFYDLMERCADSSSGSPKVGGQVRGDIFIDPAGNGRLILH